MQNAILCELMEFPVYEADPINRLFKEWKSMEKEINDNGISDHVMWQEYWKNTTQTYAIALKKKR